MAKARRRPGRKGGGGGSGNPQRRAAEAHLAALVDPVERALARLRHLLVFGDASDPLQAVCVPALVLDAIVAANADVLPAERCVDDCTTLVHAYAQLGIKAQVRAVELTITDTRTGEASTHGSPTPWWEDGMIHGHTVVWIPQPGCLIDPTADQFAPLRAQDSGPVIATRSPGDEGPVRLQRGRLQLSYSLASHQASAELLDHPDAQADLLGHRRRGLNIASAALAVMDEHLPSARRRRIPHPRVAALLAAITGLPDSRTPEGDWRFAVPGPDGKPIHLRLDELPLAAKTPPVIPTEGLTHSGETRA